MASNRRLLIVLIGWAVFCLFFAAWLLFTWGGSTTTQRIDDIGESVIAFVAAGACAFTAVRHRGRTRAAWALMSLSAVAWGAGELAWLYHELINGQRVPVPALADFRDLMAGPFAIRGGLVL